MARGEGLGILAIVAIAACCALPIAAVAGAGLLSVVGGALARYWPLTIIGAAVLAWAGYRLARIVRARNRALRGGGGGR